MVLKPCWLRVGVLLCVLSPGPAAAQELPRVLIKTEMGSMEVEIDTIRAPVTAGNFLSYVDHSAYRGGRFHRTVRSDDQRESSVKIDIIQGGPDPSRAKDFSPIPLERTKDTGLSHQDGTISMARDGPDTATSDFFITIGPQPELDFGGKRNPDGQGFAAFGKVIRGMDVVRLIHTARARKQQLTPPIQIIDITRMR